MYLIMLCGLSGCLNNLCDGTCENGGACYSGSCTCATGYDGTTCENISRLRLLSDDSTTGRYITASGGDACNSQQYSMSITANTDIYMVSISNFAGSGLTANNVYISGQSFYIIDSLQSSTLIISDIAGTVADDGSTITYTYTAYNRITEATNSCSGTAIKQ